MRRCGAAIPAARGAREELVIPRRSFTARNWKVTDARLALADVEILAEMSFLQRGLVACAARLNGLANAYYARRDYARAEPLYVNALEIRKEHLGENHRDYAASLNSLATLYRSRGDSARRTTLR